MPDRGDWQQLAKQILLRASILSDQEWLRLADRLEADLHANARTIYDTYQYFDESGPSPSMRELLVWTHCTILSCPPDRLQDYKDLDEGPGLAALARQAVRADFCYDGDRQDIARRLLWLGGCLRALDQLLHSEQYHEPEGAGPGIADLWALPEYGCAVVPVDRSHRAQLNKPFIRRGSRFHAIIPLRIGNYQVRFVDHPHLKRGFRLSARRPKRYGAAIFPGLELNHRLEHERQFLITGLHGASCDAPVEEHLAQAVEEGCDIVVWPELTLPDEEAGQIRDRLRHRPLSQSHKPQILVLGSWHRPAEQADHYHNRSIVLAGSGKVLAHYDKRMKFRLKRKSGKEILPDLVEAIVPGRELPIFVTDDRLVSIAICLDFCEDCSPPPYHVLDVDLALVPSMGLRNTVEQHAVHADTLHTRYSAETFVVQQSPLLKGECLPAGEAAGYSFLSPVTNPDSYPQNVSFRVFER